MRHIISDPEVVPVPTPLRQPSVRRQLEQPKATAVGLRVQTQRESEENQNSEFRTQNLTNPGLFSLEFEHVAKDNGHSIKASTYSKKDVQNNSYSISVSQNVKAGAEKECVTAPPVFKWLQDKMTHDNQTAADQSVSMQAEQSSNLDAISSPDWPSFNPLQRRRSSSSNSATLDYNNAVNEFKSFGTF